MKKITYLFLFVGILFSAVGYASDDTATEMARQEQIGKYNDYDEVLYEHFKRYEKTPSPGIAMSKKEVLYYTEYTKNEADNNSTTDKKQKTRNKNKTFFLTGYCFGGKSQEISRLSEYEYLKCNFKNVNAELAVLLIPDAFSKALIGKPLYVEVKGQRYQVLGGVVMNQDRTSINLAEIVNDRKIETFLGRTGIAAGNIATTQAQQYLADRKAARKKQTTTYLNNGAGTNPQVVQSTNTENPKASDYFLTAGVQLISQMVKTGSELFVNDLPYLFKTKKNAIYYTDIMVTDEDNFLPEINIQGNSLAKKEDIKNANKKSVITLDRQQNNYTGKTIYAKKQ